MGLFASLLAFSLLDPMGVDSDSAVVEIVPVAVEEDARAETSSFKSFAYAVHAMTGEGPREVAPVALLGVEIPVAEGFSLFRAVSVATGKSGSVRDIPVPVADGAVMGVKWTF